MAATAEERIPALTTSDEIFSLAVPFATFASEPRIGANAARGKKPHQGIFSKNRRLCVGAIWPKWPGTHQVSGQWWSETVLGIVIDANGNTLSDPSGKSYSWDFENRLTQAVISGTGTTTFRYDPFGRRIQKSGPLGTTNYLYDGLEVSAGVIEEVDNAGNVLARYTQGTRIDEPLAQYLSSTASFYDADGLGSITSLTNSTGALADSYIYNAFGTQVATTGSLVNPFQYTARELDNETGLYYYRARYYDPQVGRFTSEDPIKFDGGINFYRYVRDNPTNYVDPLGRAFCFFFVRAGRLVCYDNSRDNLLLDIPVASGNNGGGSQCKNNPKCERDRDRGPIPSGWWEWTDDPTSKPNGKVLVPMAGTDTFGRDLFRTHSCKNAFGPSATSPFCSAGCITGSADDIRRLNRLLDSEPWNILSVQSEP